MPDIGWESGFGRREAAESAVEISDAGPLSMIDLRLAEDDEASRKAVAKFLGFDLPDLPRTSTAKGEIHALWMSIDQWLLVAPVVQRKKQISGLSDALKSGFSAITDLSDARTVIRLKGDGGREIIMKGGAADLLADDFLPGSVRRLNLASIGAMVHLRGLEPEEIDLYVFRSYTDFALRWLEAASKPGAAIRLFGSAPPPPV